VASQRLVHHLSSLSMDAKPYYEGLRCASFNNSLASASFLLDAMQHAVTRDQPTIACSLASFALSSSSRCWSELQPGQWANTARPPPGPAAASAWGEVTADGLSKPAEGVGQQAEAVGQQAEAVGQQAEAVGDSIIRPQCWSGRWCLNKQHHHHHQHHYHHHKACAAEACSSSLNRHTGSTRLLIDRLDQ
jgi:hypothetical protein